MRTPRVTLCPQGAEPAVARALEPAVRARDAGPVEPSRADLALALHSRGLSAAREAGVPQCVALAPDLSLRQAEALRSADHLLVAHDVLASALRRRGLEASRVQVAGPVPPDGFAPARDRNRAAERAGLAADRTVVLVPAAMFEAYGIQALLMQLGLVERPVSWLLDVGRDARLADTLRNQVPVHGLDALLLADDSDAPSSWALAHAVLARPEGPEVTRALGVGAAVLTVGGESLEAGALEASGVGRRAEAIAGLAVTLEGALSPASLDAACQAVRTLDAPGSADRAVDLSILAWQAQARRGVGLPIGLERLGEPAAAHDPAAPAASAEGEQDLDARIEAELEALKKKL